MSEIQEYYCNNKPLYKGFEKHHPDCNMCEDDHRMCHNETYTFSIDFKIRVAVIPSCWHHFFTSSPTLSIQKKLAESISGRDLHVFRNDLCEMPKYNPEMSYVYEEVFIPIYPINYRYFILTSVKHAPRILEDEDYSVTQFGYEYEDHKKDLPKRNIMNLRNQNFLNQTRKSEVFLPTDLEHLFSLLNKQINERD